MNKRILQEKVNKRILQKKENKIKELEKELESLKLNFCKCGYCKNADLYKPAYTYPYFDPRCRITGNEIKPDDNACRDFQLIGRCSK